MHFIAHFFDFLTNIVWDLIKLFFGVVVIAGVVWAYIWFTKAYRAMPWHRRDGE